MKKLTLIRHAKSDWSIEGQIDFERGLALRGEKQIKQIGKILKKLKPKFDYILCSPALRTTLTLEGLCDEYKELKKVPTIFSQEIYDYAEGKTEEMINLIEKAEDKIDSFVIIGHNDLLDELIEKLTNVNGLHMSTLAIAEIRFEIDSWENIRKKGKIKMFICPTK